MELCTATKTVPRRRGTVAPAAPLLAASLLLVASCADWPDVLDPSDWYSAVVGEEAAPSSPEPLPGSAEGYPDLSDVPEAPEDLPTREEIDRIAESLEADLADARETADVVRADDGVQSLVAQSERDAEAVVAAPRQEAAAESGPPEPPPDGAAVEDPVPAEEALVAATSADEPTIPPEEPTFDELFGASGPATSVAVSETATGDAAFAPIGAAPGPETLVAVIRFGHGSSALGAEEKRIVAELAAAHAQAGGRIRLVGHASRSAGALTDADGSLANFEISLDRATAVAEELIRNGAPRDAILIEAASDGSSMAAAAGVEDEAVDRRVEVFFGS